MALQPTLPTGACLRMLAQRGARLACSDAGGSVDAPRNGADSLDRLARRGADPGDLRHRLARTSGRWNLSLVGKRPGDRSADEGRAVARAGGAV